MRLTKVYLKGIKKMIKVRNLIQVHCWNRKAGTHTKTHKVKRANDKIKMKKEFNF